MNNEIGRKITSLTLMTIMVAGGMTFAVPGVMPAAHAANANLFVSAENSQFNNYFGGPMVIEIVINDPDIKDTDDSKGEPDVTVNGKIVRMLQGSDGLWYAYFADRSQALLADATTDSIGDGLDFGDLCNRNTVIDGVTFTDTQGIAVARDADNIANEGTIAACNGADGTMDDAADLGATLGNNVVRESKTLSENNNDQIGQIGADLDGDQDYALDRAWPIVQLYDFNPTGNVVVQYNKGGNPQTVTLTFDTLDGTLDASLDRDKYPQGAALHATLTDQGLNIDPTDEDSWTFETNPATPAIHYQLFDESGEPAGIDCSGGLDPDVCETDELDANDVNSPDVSGSLGDFLFEDGGVLTIDRDAQGTGTDVLIFQNNADSFTDTFSHAALDESVTLVELGPNSGVFANYDELDTSNIVIADGALRGTSATISWDDTGYTAVVGFDFANIDIQPADDTWNSGEAIPVVLMDQDANKNSRFDEDLDLNDPGVSLIPSMQIGSPITLASIDANGAHDLGGDTDISIEVQSFSDRALITATDDISHAGDDDLNIVLDVTGADLFEFAGIDGASGNDLTDDFSGFVVFNWDLRSIVEASGADNVDITLGGAIVTNGAAQGEMIFDNNNLGADDIDTLVAGLANDNTPITIEVHLDGMDMDIPEGTVLPIVIDFFSFGFTDDGADPAERVGNMIVRFELEENGDNTGEFVGEIEYVMLNQLNILDADTYDGIGTIADDPVIIVTQDFTDEDSLRVNYNDLGADGVVTPVGDQEEAPTHSGTVSFDNDSYKIADTVLITLEDQDLNVDSDLREIYTVVSPNVNAAFAFVDGNNNGVIDNNGEIEVVRGGFGLVDGTTATLGGVTFTYTADADTIAEENEITSGDFTGATTIPNGSVATIGDVVNDAAAENVGVAGLANDGLGILLNVTFDDELWAAQGADLRTAATGDTNYCVNTNYSTFNDGLASTGITMVETSIDSGIFTGDFQIPDFYCSRNNGGVQASTTGTDIEVNYIDYRDASGEIIEVGDGAGVRANTGSVSLDRTVYPVPFGVPVNFGASTELSTDGRSVFPVHATGISSADGDAANAGDNDGILLDRNEVLRNGDLTIHVRVNDPDFDISASGSDSINRDVAGGEGQGPVKISVIRGAEEVTIAYAGGAEATPGLIGTDESDPGDVRHLGPIAETAPDSGIFELDLTLRYTDGPANNRCPETTDYTPLGGNADLVANPNDDRFHLPGGATTDDYCILQGDILQVEYTDPEDASGDVNTVTDSATFDLRNGVLQTDKSVYIIGGDMIMTLIEPDLDLENDEAETYDLDLIEWDSDAATLTMGDLGGEAAAFDPEPSNFRETGDSTGIFQIVIEIPEELAGDRLERGEEIVLEYTDWGPSGSDYVGEEDEDVNVTIYTSNFGATVELDQKVYSWTDKVFITIVAPDHNFDGDLVDEIGNTDTDPIKISTRGFDLDNYKLVETGTDTGIFTGEVILVGFKHDADGDSTTGDADGFDAGNTDTRGNGPTDGFLETDDDDGITVSFEFSEDETVVGSALIRWNIGEVQWLEASYPASGTGVVRIIDPDMNLDPEAVDNFDVDIWSDSDAGGIDLTVTETNEATGIFEGTVFFTTFDESSGHRLRVAEGDTVTAEYEDNTLPDPYTTADELDITATSLIGTVVPPLERAPAANLRTVDAFGNSLDTVSVGQQVQISADLANGQDREQSFAYLVQIQDGNGVTVSLAWITGSLASGQSFSPALSWIPSEAGTYTATAFVWESVDNPTALSPPVSTTVTVN